MLRAMEDRLEAEVKLDVKKAQQMSSEAFSYTLGKPDSFSASFHDVEQKLFHRQTNALDNPPFQFQTGQVRLQFGDNFLDTAFIQTVFLECQCR